MRNYPTCKELTYHDVLAVQIKNCEPLVFGPALAIDKIPENKNSYVTDLCEYFFKGSIMTVL